MAADLRARGDERPRAAGIGSVADAQVAQPGDRWAASLLRPRRARRQRSG